MNNLLNGMVKIWQGLPDKSKVAIVDNLALKNRHILQMGSQLMKYYVETANYQGPPDQSEQDQQQYHNQSHQANKKQKDDDDIIDVEWTEKK